MVRTRSKKTSIRNMPAGNTPAKTSPVEEVAP